MATSSEFRVRAVYDFTGLDPTELSFKADDQLTVTSTTVGNGWWYAVDANGQAGVIPENHLEVIAEPTVPPVAAELYANFDPFPNTEQPVAPSVEQPIYGNETPSNEWLVFESEPTAAPNTQPSNETDPPLNADSSGDPYTTVTDVTSTPLADPVPTEPAIDWYTSSPDILQNSWTQPSQGPPDSMYQYEYPPPSMTTQPVTSLDELYITPSLYEPTQPPNNNYYETSMPLFSPPMNTNPIGASLPSEPVPEPISLPVLSRDVPAPASKKKEEKSKSGFFTLKRSSAPDEKKRRASLDVLKETPATTASKTKHDADSDFSDPDPQTPTGGARAPNTSESKATSKARFFDKHGLDGFILNGFKSKSEERVAIAYDEHQGGVYWSPHPTLPPFTCKVEEPSKGTKLGGLKAFMEYKIHVQIPGARVVGRRYKQFDWLHEQLVNKFRFICIPPLPGKQIAGRFEHEFVEERRRQLELWLNRICHHPVLCASFPVQHFVTCELTEKNNKDWKAGKRKIEKDDLREASWLHCVTLNSACPSETQVATQVETFAQQQPALEVHMKNLSLGLSKYVGQHTEVYERDIQRIGELFGRMHTAIHADTNTPGNQQLSTAVAQISASYNTIAVLYKSKASEGLRFFNEHLQDYIGVLACFPLILGIHKSEAEFIRTVQQRGPTATADYNGALQRHTIFNHVILAEINLFQKDKVHDLRNHMKTVVSEQIQFYERVTNELRTALDTLQ